MFSLECDESLQIGGLLSIIFIRIPVFFPFSGVHRLPIKVEECSRAMRSQKGSFWRVSPFSHFGVFSILFYICNFVIFETVHFSFLFILILLDSSLLLYLENWVVAVQLVFLDLGGST